MAAANLLTLRFKLPYKEMFAAVDKIREYLSRYEVVDYSAKRSGLFKDTIILDVTVTPIGELSDPRGIRTELIKDGEILWVNYC